MIINMDDVKYVLSSCSISTQNTFKKYKNINELLFDPKYHEVLYLFCKYIINSRSLDIECCAKFYLKSSAFFHMFYMFRSKKIPWSEMEEVIRQDVYYRSWYEKFFEFRI